MPLHPFDLIVIGSGPAGERGAAFAAELGKKVALIEKNHVLGGTVANLGTLPSKTLRESALYLTGFRQRSIHGISLTIADHVSAQEFLHRERLVRQLEQTRIRTHLESSHVQLYHGSASFIDSHTIRVKSETEQGAEEFLSASTILIATGSSPYRPPLFPADNPAVFDSESILHLNEIPKSLTIVGGGVIGCEYACIFAALGVHITLVDDDTRLLPFLDSEISAALLASMRAQMIDVRLGEQVAGFRSSAMQVVALQSGHIISANAVLVTAGRRGNTASLDLDAANLSANERGLLNVNEHYQTNQPHIYATGDVTGFPSLASSAREQALEAMTHAFAPEKDAAVLPIQPYGIYTIPECSMAGETEDSLTRLGTPWISGIAHFAGNARGQIIGARVGFVKLLFHRETLQLLGVHIIGEQASELVHIGLIALQSHATTDLFLKTCFNYPTLSDLYKTATLDALTKRQPQKSPSTILKPTGGK